MSSNGGASEPEENDVRRGRSAPDQSLPMLSEKYTPNSSSGYEEPDDVGSWYGRIILGGLIFLTLPIQAALYPIAGVAGLVAGAAAYLAFSRLGMDRDAVLGSSWSACFSVLVPAMRVEIWLENRTPTYRMLRHWLRLAVLGGWMYYFGVYDHLDPPREAALVAILFAVLMHFFLRAQLAMGLWHVLQSSYWVRKP